MADFNFDVQPQNRPMAGISLADLVAAKQSPLTTTLQGMAPVLQALQQKKLMAQRQALMAQASGGDPQELSMMQLNPSYVPAQLKKERMALSPEVSQTISEKTKAPIPERGFYYDDEANTLLKAGGSGGRMGGGVEPGTPEWAAVKNSILTNKATLDDAFRGFNQAKRQLMIAEINKEHPDFSFPAARGVAKASEGSLAYPGSAQAQRFIRTARSTLPQLKTLDNLSQNVKRTQIQMANKLGQDAATQFGNQQTNRLKTQVNQIALNMQRLYPTGSDEKLNIDLKNLNQAQTAEQLHDSISLIFKDIVNMRNATEGNASLDFLYPDEKSLGLYPQTAETGATLGGKATPGVNKTGDPLGIL